ncbi:MAG: hypothetical protein IJI85_10340 [Clostridia bacterium]|nr:hypothetical protein [Lentisphaeria bacterium]MBR0422958.1 hypothetical protein [Clostridia bacterium]
MRWNLCFPFPPGDCWCLTRYVRDFAEQYPEDILSPVVPRPEMFRHNPHFRAAVPGAEQIVFRFETPRGRRPVWGNIDPADTMVGEIYAGINELTGREVQVRTPAPEIYFTAEEKRYSLVPLDRPVCIVNAGYKSDIPVKFFGTDNFQRVVDALGDRVLFVQVGASRRGTDFHPRLRGVLDLIGKTSLRELALLVYHADFVLTGISQLHHLAGIETYKPRTCITVAGGREPENWANCHLRDGVKWEWIAANADFRSCCENDPAFHPLPGCWERDCASGRVPPCMKSISPERIIEIFEKELKK